MTDGNAQTPPGWYYAAGDPPGTQRYWDGTQWQGGPQPVAAGGPGAMATGAQLGGPGERLVARIIDILVLIIPVIVVSVALGQGFVASIITFLIAAGYEVYLLGTKGATIGKSVMSLKVVNEDYTDITMETAVRRYAINLVQIVPVIGPIIQLVVGLATIVMVFSDSRRQVPWDKIAKTLVISTK